MSKPSLIIASIAFAWGAQAGTLTVTNTSDGPAPGPVGSLRRAISDAASGDTINFSLPENSTVTLTSGQLLIEKNLTISGPGANLLRVTAPGAGIFMIPGLSDVTISGLTIANGVASDGSLRGGGIYNAAGTVTISNSIVSGNMAECCAGGIYNNGTMTIARSTISGNRAENGGGIYNNGTMTITDSTISGNSSLDTGGGIYNRANLIISNSTISANSAGYGGGILSEVGTITITNSTISGNVACNIGGGIERLDGTLTARNTIIAGNTAMNVVPDVDGELTSQGYNLIGNTSGTTITGTTIGNQLNVDPRLGPLQDNGGPTFTHALLSGSTALERGDSGGSITDQRGFARPVDSPAFANIGDGSDIGAYEVQADLLPGCNNIDGVVHNNDDSGAGSLRAVIANVCAGSTITFAANVRGVINLTGGELLIDKTLKIIGPGANLLTVQRSAAAGTPNFRIFNIARFIVTISGLTIANGNTNAGGAGNGGGISNGGTLTLTNSVISGNTASLSSAGGILNGSGTLTIINSTISGNSATGGFGGGIWNSSGTLTITNSTILGNSASEPGLGIGSGGGIQNTGGTVTVTNSTISGNTAQLSGGGINNNGTLKITNSTISGNRALGDRGGGLLNFSATTLTNSTISGNSATGAGGGVHNAGGTVRARNTIIALNTGASSPDVNGALTSEGFNLLGNNAGANIAPVQFSDQIGVTAAQLNLGPLQDNGGPARTHALLTGSFAIDKGHSSGSSTDQRGFSRPADNPAIANPSGGDGGDIGAFEFGGAAASLKILSITRSGNGPVVLQVAGFAYGVHRIQASVDLGFGSFTDIATVTADAAGRFQYQDAVAGLTKFYRVVFP